MSLVESLGGARSARGAIVQMDQPSAPLRGWLRRLSNRTYQRIVTATMRGCLAAEAQGPEALARYIARQRKLHMNLDAPVLARVETEAVRQAGPGAGVSPPPLAAEWFAPKGAEPRGFVFYVHGGSFIAERSPRITRLVARFAASADARVFAPSYRLAPEHPCPAAVEDVLASWTWLRETWPDEPVVALAESAGAAILLAAMQQARDRGLPLPCGLVLLSPWVDLSLQSWSVTSASLLGTTPYTMESLALVARFYLNGRSALDPAASPIFGSFEGFPPMLIHASKGDILYDDAVRLAEKVRGVGGDLTIRLWTDETHVWERMSTPKAQQSISLAADFIRRRLDSEAARVG
jgi:epsilon-lactone hydrolase